MSYNVQWVHRVRDRLRELLSVDHAPTLDIEWLILRCDDTLRYTERLQEPSARQLIKDLRYFDDEFPGVLPDDILTMLREMDA